MLGRAGFSPEGIVLFDRLEAENLSLESKIQSLESENTKLTYKRLYYKGLFYGRRSEKRMPPPPDGQLFLPFGQESIREETPDIKPIVEEIQVESHQRRTNLKENQKKALRQEIPSEIERRVRIMEPSGINTGERVKKG